MAPADFIDDRAPRGMRRCFAAAEPVPQLRILLIEQCGKCGFCRIVRRRPALLEVPAEQLIELAHAAAAVPAQTRQVRAHLSKPYASTAHNDHKAMPPRK